MKKSLFIYLIMIVTLMAFIAGCRTEPNPQEIKDIPSGAEEVLSLQLNSQGGTFSTGKIDVSGNGYIILEIKNITGTLKAIEIKDALTSDVVYTISKPKAALYDSGYFDYDANSEYKLNFVGAKDVTADFIAYFVKDDNA